MGLSRETCLEHCLDSRWEYWLHGLASPARLKREGITVRQIPYESKAV